MKTNLDEKTIESIGFIVDYYGDKKVIKKMVDKVIFKLMMYLLENEEATPNKELNEAIYWCNQLGEAFDCE